MCLVRHWNSIFKIEDPFTMTENNSLTTLPTLPSEWMVEFMFKPTNYDNPDWTSIFHMTIGGNKGNMGDRNPALFFRPSQGFYFVSSALTNYFTLFPAPTVDKWTKLRLSEELQNEKIKLKFFNDDEEMLSVDNSNAVGFKDIKVYASDPWYAAQPGFIKNLSIKIKR